MSSDIFYKAARTLLKASQLRIPMMDTFAEIMRIYMTEEQAEFVSNLKSKESYTFEELKSLVELDDDLLKQKLESCMKIAVINSSTNKKQE